MASIDRSNRTVIEHLNGRLLGPLNVETAPGDQWVITTVRTTNPTSTWTQQYADQLYDALRDLPGHPAVRRSDIRDRMVIVWDGV